MAARSIEEIPFGSFHRRLTVYANATAAGIATAISRIGAAAGTFVLPIGLERFGAPAVMWTSCILSLIGVAIALLWAPETKGMTLAESSAAAR